jgi:TrmH family RNA methyltransferase
VLLELTAGRGTGSIVGLVRRAQLPSLAEILAGIEGGPRVVVVAVDIEDPGNVGALVRTALASGAAAFLEVGASDAHHPRAVRTSMGSVFKLPILGFATVRELLGEVDRAGLRKIGALSRGGDPPHTLAPGGGGVALFLGAEAFGLPPEVVAAMDAAVSVPMASGVDSLSVNAAAAVILYEITGRAGGVPAS